MHTYFGSCFWLLVPVLLWNLLLTSRLPVALQPAEFWRDIPPWIGVPENVLRALVLSVPLVMRLELRSPRQKAALALFAAGLAAYFASWMVLIASPASRWSTSAAGFSAPAYTPALWLCGLGLLPERLTITRLPYRRWPYFALAAGFLVFHNLHAAIVYGRNY
jgi:hypothetical protein